ncbi:hypothetical protein GCM10023263_48470 [Phytohabitans rumicis]
MPWLLLGALVLAQIGYPLTSGSGRAGLTVVTVLIGYATSVTHALVSRGVRVTAVLVAVTTGGGLAVEALGVATGFPFGAYAYAGDLGPKLAGVPLVIPLAWTWMAWPAWVVAGRVTTRWRVPLAAIALAGWDLFLDPQMVAEGYWTWSDPHPALPGVPGVPLTNYLAWLLVALLMMSALSQLLGRDPCYAKSDNRVPFLALTWAYASSAVAQAVFLDLPGTVLTPLSWLLAATVGALTLHTAVNALLLRRLRAPGEAVDEPVAVLLPVRNEAGRVEPCLRALLAQRGVPRLRIVALDDGSTDGTAGMIEEHGIRVVEGAPPPAGWLGKPYACQQLADLVPDASVLVFVDADVVLAPDAVAAAVAGLRAARADLLSPYPRMVARTAGERLIQPLLQWSWLTFLPLRAMERSARPSLAAAGGQFLVADRAGYDRAGGHAAVHDQVLEDVALARAVKRAGGRIALADASALASCRMYAGWRELADGYAKSLWAAVGWPVVLLLLALYALPPLLVTVAPAAGLTAYLLGVAGRVISAAATGGRAWPDALAQPASVVAFAWLVARSRRLHRQGRLTWRGRSVP